MYTLKDGVLTIDDGVKEISAEDFSFEKKDIKSVIIPEGVKKIGDNAFCDCENLTSITIPKGVEEIGDCAFCWCKNLTTVTIPESVYIGIFAFKNCAIDNLDSKCLKIKNGCALSDDGLIVLYGTNVHFTELVISEGVKSISTHAFSGFENLATVKIPDSVKKIGDSAFDGNENLTTITIPESVKEVGDFAFAECTSLKNIIFQGTKEQWENIEGDFKEDLKNVEIIFEK